MLAAAALGLGIFQGLLRTGQESGRGAGSGDLHPGPEIICARPACSRGCAAARHGLHGHVLRCARRGIRAPTATGASVSNGPDQLACTPGSLGVAVWQPAYTGRAREIPRRPAPNGRACQCHCQPTTTRRPRRAARTPMSAAAALISVPGFFFSSLEKGFAAEIKEREVDQAMHAHIKERRRGTRGPFFSTVKGRGGAFFCRR